MKPISIVTIQTEFNSKFVVTKKNPYSDIRLVRFPSSFGRGPDKALMPRDLVCSKRKSVRLDAKNCKVILRFISAHEMMIRVVNLTCTA
jgi:hypothetical protein